MAASPSRRGVIFADLKRAFPRQEITGEMMAVYARELADLPDDALEAAARTAIRKGVFFPSIAELRSAAAELSLALPAPDEALGQIEARVSWAKLGCEGDPPAVHPLVREALEAVGGWHSYKAADNPSILRSQFLNLYREKRARLIDSVQVGDLAALPPAAARAALPEAT